MALDQAVLVVLNDGTYSWLADGTENKQTKQTIAEGSETPTPLTPEAPAAWHQGSHNNRRTDGHPSPPNKPAHQGCIPGERSPGN